MIKMMEWIGALIAILCLLEMVSNPKKVIREIQRGPAPELRKFNESLH